MKWKLNIRKEVTVIASAIVLLFLISFTERKQDAIACKDIVVELDNLNENHFLDEADVLKLIEGSGVAIKGNNIQQIKLREIEQKLIYDKHIAEAQLFGDLKGNVVVKIALRRPIARVVQHDAPDAYIAEDGTVMPTSERYTSRVLLLSGGYVKQLLESQDLSKTDEGKHILEMIKFVNNDKFWKAQVAQMDINSTGKITIYPLVTEQKVEFGKAEDIENKFEKLMIFYKRILPQRGWTKYSRVNLEYKEQIIAE